MTHENNPATRLIKQGDKLYWKNPYPFNTNPVECESFEIWATANPIHAIGDWPDKEEFSRGEVEIVPQCFDYEFNEWRVIKSPIEQFEDLKRLYKNVRLAARYKGELKLSDKIGHINCDPEALKDPEFVNAVNNMAEMAYNMPAKNQLRNPLLEQIRKDTPEEVKQYTDAHIRALDLLEDYKEQFRAEVIKNLEAEFEHHPKYTAIYGVFRHAIEIVKETQIK